MRKAPASQGAEPSPVAGAVESIGRGVRRLGGGIRRRIAYFGALTNLLGITSRWLFLGLVSPRVRFRRRAVVEQMFRIGVRAVPIVMLVQVFIGLIMALQVAPTLESYGQLERVADVVAIAIIRELGPLITAVVLSGFAGASIAAEIGSMVEGEEIKALRAHALDPYAFLVVPRFVATVLAMTGLCVIADLLGVLGGLATAIWVLDVPLHTYLDLTQAALDLTDYLTGIFKAGVFGLLISIIACHAGMTTSGGAVGVGHATTDTVVKCIVGLIATDAVFTAIFYTWGI